jgi:hypothetical protein
VYKTQLVVCLIRRLLSYTPRGPHHPRPPLSFVCWLWQQQTEQVVFRSACSLQRAVITQDPDARPRWITHIVVFGSCRMSRLWCSDLGLSSRTSQECQRQACILYLQQQRVAWRRPIVRSTRRLWTAFLYLGKSKPLCLLLASRGRGPGLSSYARVCDLPLSPSTTFHPHTHLPPQSTLGWCGQ